MDGKDSMQIDKEQYTIGDLFKKIINDKIAKIHTSIPAEIVKKNTNNTVNVRPLIKDFNLNKEYTELPIITNVPIQFFKTSIALISVPINIGDTGTLTFSERSIKNWQAKGGLQNPEDNRRFNLTDCYFCPNLMQDGVGKTIDDNLNIILDNSYIKIKNDGSIEIEGGEIKIGSSASEYAVKGDTLQNLINDFINIYNTHTHPGIGTPPSATGTPLDGSELSTKILVE